MKNLKLFCIAALLLIGSTAFGQTFGNMAKVGQHINHIPYKLTYLMSGDDGTVGYTFDDGVMEYVGIEVKHYSVQTKNNIVTISSMIFNYRDYHRFLNIIRSSMMGEPHQVDEGMLYWFIGEYTIALSAEKEAQDTFFFMVVK